MTLSLRDWEPWRDHTPEEWTGNSAARPRKPDATPERLPPRPPLGVWATDSPGAGAEAEPLPRGQAPWLLPSQVEVWKADTQSWVVNARALTALAKRSAYSPTAWPDEIDDRLSVGGRVRVTYPAGPAHLLPSPLALTARLTQQTGSVNVNGQPIFPRLLGRSALTPSGRPRRGWHPALLTSPLTYTPSQPLILELDFGSARCSQLILALPGTVSGDIAG